MELMIGIIVILFLAAIIGGILGFASFFRISKLEDSYRQLSKELKQLKATLSRPAPQEPPTENKEPISEQPPIKISTPVPAAPAPTNKLRETQLSKASNPSPNTTKTQNPIWLDHLIENWMIWLGGVCVGLAGIFLVKYSISAGLLGPKTQITLAIVIGLTLHSVAEWLRRRHGKSDPVFASLAGGASITLYAALLAALHIYELMQPSWAFVLLAVVSLMTMGLALIHGPVLAIMGLVGAYVVPLLVSTNSGNMVAALIYSLIITGSALLLIRYVFRDWLWWSLVAGSLGWWLISLSTNQADSFHGIYLALLAWGILAIPQFDWLLSNKQSDSSFEPERQKFIIANQSISMHQLVILLVTLAWGLSMYRQSYGAMSFVLSAPLLGVVFLASSGRQSLSLLPWIALTVQWVVWFAIGFEPVAGSNGYQFQPLAAELIDQFIIFASAMTLIYSGLSIWQWHRQGFSHSRASLALITPLAWMSLTYLHVHGHTPSILWSSLTLLLGLIYALVAGIRLQKNKQDDVALWLTLSAHFAYSLAAVLLFREALLSLALAAQLLSLSWLMKRYHFSWLELLTKVVLSLIVIRLTLNPWLADYPTDVHWSLYTYGGSTLFAYLASRLCAPNHPLRRWLEAATLHLLVLTFATELRYWLYDGQIFISEYSLVEAAIHTSLGAALSLIYYHRATLSDTLGTFYRVCSKLLLILATASYAINVVIQNPWWSGETISGTPIFNILLLAYGAPIIWAILIARFYSSSFKKMALRVAGFATLLFVTLEIRHLWQGSSLSLSQSTSDGEVYTYSIVWLLLSIPAVLFGTHWNNKELYRTGMGLLGFVIGKIFLVDMAGLDGLWRVASFMGLGLSLLALAWLHQRVAKRPLEHRN
ncbi:DUF2339 domain-containing protein [Kangiella sp. M94]